MAVHRSMKNLTKEVLDEYLEAAKLCVANRKSDDGLLGFPATLLLLSVIDAMGHIKRVGTGSVRLGVLKMAEFEVSINDKQVNNLKKWYRNQLSHCGVLSKGVALTPDFDGNPFEYDENEQLTKIRVPVLLKTVCRAWVRIRETEFLPADVHERNAPQKSAFADGSLSTLTPPASGFGGPFEDA